jgi:hypothetical protein
MSLKHGEIVTFGITLLQHCAGATIEKVAETLRGQPATGTPLTSLWLMRIMQEEEGPGGQENKPLPVIMALEGSEAPGGGMMTDALDGGRGTACEQQKGSAQLMMTAHMIVRMHDGRWRGGAFARAMTVFDRNVMK